MREGFEVLVITSGHETWSQGDPVDLWEILGILPNLVTVSLAVNWVFLSPYSTIPQFIAKLTQKLQKSKLRNLYLDFGDFQGAREIQDWVYALSSLNTLSELLILCDNCELVAPVGAGHNAAAGPMGSPSSDVTADQITNMLAIDLPETDVLCYDYSLPGDTFERPDPMGGVFLPRTQPAWKSHPSVLLQNIRRRDNLHI